MLRSPPSKSWPDPQQGKKLGTFAKLPKVVKKWEGPLLNIPFLCYLISGTATGKTTT
jgi:hypothetical protein